MSVSEEAMAFSTEAAYTRNSDIIQEQIDNAFKAHPLNEDQSARFAQLKEAFRVVSMLVNNLCSSGRYRSLALTNLEEASMWASKSIATE